jgi:hypothetical protein
VFTNMLRTAELDMAELVNASNINIFFADAAWAIRSTHHTVLKASPGAAIFRRDVLFDILFIADWKTIGEHRQRLTECNIDCINEGRIDYDYKVGLVGVSVVGRLYSVQYKSIFGAPDKVRRNTSDQARQLSQV